MPESNLTAHDIVSTFSSNFIDSAANESVAKGFIALSKQSNSNLQHSNFHAENIGSALLKLKNSKALDIYGQNKKKKHIVQAHPRIFLALKHLLNSSILQGNTPG